jgi:hypothetical protein
MSRQESFENNPTNTSAGYQQPSFHQFQNSSDTQP